MTDSAEQKAPFPLKFHYIKSASFRVLHVDGALGGLTPRGLIHMVTFSERAAIPRLVEQDYTLEDGHPVGDPRTIDTREGIVREMDADLIMTLATATEMRDWLTTKIDELSRLINNPLAGQKHA